MNCCSCQHLFSSDLDFYYVAFSYIYAVEFFVYVCCKLSIIYTCICRYWPKLPCQQSQNVLSIFLWICSSGYGVQVNVDLYDTSNEDLFPSQSSPYYLVLTCTFRSPVRAVTSGLSPSGLWHQSCHPQGCDIRALFDWFVMPGIDDFFY